MLQTSLRWHLRVFVLVNGFLAAINLAFAPSSWWFMWVVGTWGIGLALHAFAVRDATATATAPVARAARGRSASRASEPAAGEPEEDLGSARTRLSERAPPFAPAAATNASTDAPTQSRFASGAVDALPPRDASLEPGQCVAGRFVVERALGRGGMGEVYLAQDSLLGERVALKVISASTVSASATERFRREALAARRITHPRVVRIHDIGQDGPLSFISMEYVEGLSLHELLARDGPLPLHEVRRIATQVCEGLEAAHGAGVIHRDLKPDNILIDRNGQARVIDFGLARLQSSEGLTGSGIVMGTPDYMAPEQVSGKPVDARTDVYAMGCVLYFMFTGVAPFVRDSDLAIAMAHCQERPAPLTDHRSDVPHEWVTLVSRALEKLPQDRFQTADALRLALHAS